MQYLARLLFFPFLFLSLSLVAVGCGSSGGGAAGAGGQGGQGGQGGHSSARFLSLAFTSAADTGRPKCSESSTADAVLKAKT